MRERPELFLSGRAAGAPLYGHGKRRTTTARTIPNRTQLFTGAKKECEHAGREGGVSFAESAESMEENGSGGIIIGLRSG